MPEWSIGPHSKCGVRATVPRVRIPLSPRKQTQPNRYRLVTSVFRIFPSLQTSTARRLFMLLLHSHPLTLPFTETKRQKVFDTNVLVAIVKPVCPSLYSIVSCYKHASNQLKVYYRKDLSTSPPIIKLKDFQTQTNTQLQKLTEKHAVTQRPVKQSPAKSPNACFFFVPLPK